MKKVRIGVVVGAIGMATVVGLYVFQRSESPAENEVTAPPSSPTPATVVSSEPEPSESEARVRPATAEETTKCESEDHPISSSWPVTRRWMMGFHDSLEQDLCLAEHTFQLKNGKTVTQSSQITDPSLGVATSHISVVDYYQNLGYFLLATSFMENGSYQLLNDSTGEVIGINCQRPIFSPSSSALISICTDQDGEAGTNAIGIWSRAETGEYKQVFNLENLPWRPSQLKWIDEQTIIVESEVTQGEGESVSGEVRKLQKTHDQWTLSSSAAHSPSQETNSEAGKL